jgi:hypothetical protein
MRSILSLAILSLYAAPALAANDALVAALARRAAKVPAFDATIHVVETMPKGSRFNQPGKVLPARDLVWESDNRWAADGAKYRVELNHPMGNAQGGKVALRQIRTSDGENHRLLLGGPEPTSRGIIEAAPNDWLFADWHFRPLAIQFRGTEKRLLGGDPADLRLVAKDQDLDGVKCDQYEHRAGQRETTYWFDPARDYALVRLITKGTAGDFHIEVTYGQRAGVGLVPDSWTIVESRGDKVRGTSVIRLTDFATTVDADAFELEFPKRTLVHDERRQNATYRVDDLGRLIELDALGTPVGSSVLPVAVRLAFRQFRTWFLGGSLVGVLAVSAYLTLRWRRVRMPARHSLPTEQLPFV